ncbi:MAG: hypothetical protein CMJ80_06880 [Planctomycetaceae bacterium]|nr:hypothetical protein [Planctomycetaceae bacterium]
MSTATETKSKLSIVEAGVLLPTVIVGLCLLLPSLPAARERARSQLCRTNLRRFDLAAKQYMDKNKKPLDPVTWTLDLLPLIQNIYGADETDLKISGSPSRPNYMTCPSRQINGNEDDRTQVPHYELIVDSTEGMNWRNVKWRFRDRPRDLSDDNRIWYVGVTFTFAEADQQLRNQPGPHLNGRYNQSDAHGNPVLLPQP